MINSKLPVIWYGGDYNPEQWPKEIWQEDMRLFKLAGINVATVNVFSWSLLQPAEDRYDFSQLDAIMDMLAENGLYACLATSTAAQPHWLSVKYPEVLPVDLQGRKKTQGARVNFCPNSPKYREFSVRLAEKLAERYAGHPALLIWHIGNEYGNYCYCENCVAAFRRWLQKRYGTLEELNRRWYTSFWSQTYYDWEEIVAPTYLNVISQYGQAGSTVAQGLQLDYYRFMSESTLECYRGEYAAIKKHTPDLPVTTNLMGAFKPLDYFAWAKEMDVVSWDNYPGPHEDFRNIAFRHDLMRGLKHGQPFMLMEQTPGQVNWMDYCYQKRPGVMRLWSWQAVAHGADTVMFFQLRRSRGGPEKYHSAVISHAGHEETRIFKEVAALGRELRKLGAELLDARGYAQTAILFDWENWWALENSQGPTRAISYVDQTQTYYRALAGGRFGTDVIGLEDDFHKYKVIVAPFLYMIKPGVAAKIEKYVADGGVFVTTTMSGLVDENDLVTPGGYPGELRNLLGIWVEEIDALPPAEKNKLLVRNEYVQSGLAAAYECGILFDYIRLQGATTVAVYESDYYAGEPAVTGRRFGKGRAYYIGTCPDEKFLTDFFAYLGRLYHLTTILPSVPPGVEVTRRVKEGTEYTFILNHTNETVRIDLGAAEKLELLGGSAVSGVTPVPPNGVLILKEAK